VRTIAPKRTITALRLGQSLHCLALVDLGLSFDSRVIEPLRRIVNVLSSPAKVRN